MLCTYRAPKTIIVLFLCLVIHSIMDLRLFVCMEARVILIGNLKDNSAVLFPFSLNVSSLDPCVTLIVYCLKCFASIILHPIFVQSNKNQVNFYCQVSFLFSVCCNCCEDHDDVSQVYDVKYCMIYLYGPVFLYCFS